MDCFCGRSSCVWCSLRAERQRDAFRQQRMEWKLLQQQEKFVRQEVERAWRQSWEVFQAMYGVPGKKGR